jgi:hypothetical protein
VFNRIKVWRIRRLICDLYTSFLEPFLDFFGCIDRGVVLHKYEVVGIVWYNEVLKEGKIGVGRVSMLL